MPSATRSSQQHVAWLRGINVGGRNKLPMRDLAGVFLDLGCEDVRTYIQSGNVAYCVSSSLARMVGSRVEQALADRFGISSPVITRSARELASVIDEVPYSRSRCAQSVHVGFLARRPGRRELAALDPDRSPGDAYRVRGREIYLLLPNGVAGTRLTNKFFDSTLGTTSTFRNWRTVMKLAGMLGV